VPSSHQARRLLGGLPINYGSAAHAAIRVANNCQLPIQVAIMFMFNPWGAPSGCTYSGFLDDNQTQFCVLSWQTLQPRQTTYLADTGYDSWFYTARLLADPAGTWGTWGHSKFRTLQWAACSEGSAGCFGWDKVRGRMPHGGVDCRARFAITCPLQLATGLSPMYSPPWPTAHA